MSSENNKRIARNTLLLYFRMLLIMFVSLYTVRIVLNTLGVVDYGIYNVVGGIVAMFSFLSGTMASASQRFFSFELGQNNIEKLKKTFSTSLLLYIGLAFIVFLLSESVGLWFLNNKMDIPADRIIAANWVFQFAVFSFVVTIVAIPYNASLIAHEDMAIYAYVSVVEVLLKLLVAYLLVWFSDDKLKLYSILLFFSTLLIALIYRLICVRKYEECRYQRTVDINLVKTLLDYSGWNMIGAIANVFKIYGINIILNIFFGPVVNAARGIAFQINAALTSFITSFYMAVRPQITKAYASDNNDYMWQLVFQSSKVSFYLILILSMPVLIETDFILNLWLKKVPDNTVLFSRLLIVNILIELMNNQLVAALQAANKIKVYQAVVSVLFLIILPFSYLAFRLGASPEITFYISIAVTLLCFIPQLIIVKKELGLSIKKYFNKVITPMLVVSVISLIAPLLFYFLIEQSWTRFIVVLVVGLFSNIGAIYFFGFSISERNTVLRIIKDKLNIKLIK